MTKKRSTAEALIDLDIADLRAGGVSDFDIAVAALMPDDDERRVRVAAGMAALSVRKAMLD